MNSLGAGQPLPSLARDSRRMFKAPEKSIGELRSEEAAKLIAAAADIAVVIDRKGTIRDFSTSSELSNEACANWIGQSWLDVVTPESRKKAQDLLKPAAEASLVRWRQVNHPAGDQPDIPIRYTSLLLGTGGKVLALGQDLRPQAALQQRILEAQATMEREYARLRESETRYRALFQVSSEAVLIIEASTQKVVETNPAASQLLANGSKSITGRQFGDLFSPGSAPRALECLASAQTVPRVEGVLVESAHGGRQLLLSVSMVRQNRSTYYLVRLAPQNAAESTQGLLVRSNVLQAFEQLPDGLVLVDKDRRIMTCNTAFLDLCELSQESQLKGEPVDRWLGRVSVDIDVLFAHVREHGSTRRFATMVRGEYGGRSEVDITAVFVAGSQNPYYALSLRRLEPSATRQPRSERQMPRSVEQLTKLVGRVPLKELVRETTDIVERLCIEAALDLTRGNRASAAEMLGLSRQSFYVKLRRYGLGELDDNEQDLS
jgi:transcriptional regulator PpsR